MHVLRIDSDRVLIPGVFHIIGVFLLWNGEALFARSYLQPGMEGVEGQRNNDADCCWRRTLEDSYCLPVFTYYFALIDVFRVPVRRFSCRPMFFVVLKQGVEDDNVAVRRPCLRGGGVLTTAEATIIK